MVEHPGYYEMTDEEYRKMYERYVGHLDREDDLKDSSDSDTAESEDGTQSGGLQADGETAPEFGHETEENKSETDSESESGEGADEEIMKSEE